MNKILKWSLLIIAGLGVALFIAFQVLQKQTKKHSPEETVEYQQGEIEFHVYYNRPYKKGREIFGGLVPYGEVWRTGANEATTFATNADLMIDGKELPAGRYTLWTIPEPDAWTVIFNSKLYGWGVGWGGVASRDPAADVLQVRAPVTTLSNPVEQFTIAVEGDNPAALTLSWDRTRVAVPVRW